MTRKKTGILGGTFNPVHMVHMILAENAYRDFSLDEIILLPSGSPPHKAGRNIAPAADRLNMLKIAARDIPYFRVSDLEIRRQGYSYTADTLDKLRVDQPDTDFYFIMGGDSLFQLESWHEPERVMRDCTILAAVRNNVKADAFIARASYLREKYGAHIRLMDLPDIELSSSEIRDRCGRGRSVRFMVPAGVEDYIREKGLYRG